MFLVSLSVTLTASQQAVTIIVSQTSPRTFANKIDVCRNYDFYTVYTSFLNVLYLILKKEENSKYLEINLSVYLSIYLSIYGPARQTNLHTMFVQFFDPT